MWDQIWTNINIATMVGDNGLGIIQNAAIGVENGEISFAGTLTSLPSPPEKLSDYVYDGGGRWVLPGLIDCHTHLVYAGSRAHEFEQRLNGVSYEDIAKAGGGILSTVRDTRSVSEDALFEETIRRVRTLFHEGVTTFEMKSGYGLNLETERKILRTATRIRDELGINMQRTFLGAHALPPEYKGKADDYIDHICREILPSLHQEGLVDTVDVFCEKIGFTLAQTEKVFKKAQELGLPVKLHAEQLSNQQGTALAAKYKALSADHLEYLDEAGVKAMWDAGTVAVLLPGAFYFLREKQLPPIELFRKYKVPMAIATDHNPGTSPTLSLILMLSMACTLFRLTPEEALLGVTKNAAKALGMDKEIGTIEVGKCADLAFFDISHPRDLCYAFGENPCTGVILSGAHYSL